MVARIDGRSFTRLTKEVHNFEAPFDAKFRDLMVETFERQMEFIERDHLKVALAERPCYFDGLLSRDALQFHPLNYCLGIARAAEAPRSRGSMTLMTKAVSWWRSDACITAT